MSLKKFFLIMFCVTVMALIYIQLQVNIYALAYQGKDREKEFNKLVDDNGYVLYNIAKLKSSSHLGERLLSGNGEMDFVDQGRIVRLDVPAVAESPEQALAADRHQGKFALLVKFFTLRSEAEAKPIP